MLTPGDLVALSGGLGAGKSSFARALIRALADDPAREVPSPTFPLRIDHELPRLKVVHADLYRLGAADELQEVGLDEALTEAAVLVEWPERLPDRPGGEPPRYRTGDRRQRPARGDRGHGDMAGAAHANASDPRDFSMRAAGQARYAFQWSEMRRCGPTSGLSVRVLSPPLRGRDREGGRGRASFPSPTLPRKGGEAPS